MNADLILDAFEKIDDKYIIEAKERGFMNSGTGKSIRSLKRTFILVAAIVASLALCGFAAYEYGLFDNWLQKPSVYPIETVQSAIEGQIKKEYTLTVRIDEISVDETETKRMIERYTGSELAQSRGWTDDYLAEHFLAVRAKYVKAKLFCPEIAGLFCRIAGLFCHDSRANLSLKPVCFGIAIS